MDNSGFEFGQGQEIFIFSRASSVIQGRTQPHIQCVFALVLPGVKRPVCVAVCSLLSSGEVKNEWVTTSAAPLSLSCAQ